MESRIREPGPLLSASQCQLAPEPVEVALPTCLVALRLARHEEVVPPHVPPPRVKRLSQGPVSDAKAVERLLAACFVHEDLLAAYYVHEDLRAAYCVHEDLNFPPFEWV